MIVPSTIEVTLGKTGQGMLLRNAQLISSTQLSLPAARSRIDEILGESGNDSLFALSKATGLAAWGRKPEDLSAEDREKIARIEQQLDSHLQPDRYTGLQIGVLRNKLILAAATDSDSDRPEFRASLSDYLEVIGQTAGPAGRLAMSFDLLEMLRSHKRIRLEQITEAEIRRFMALQPVSQQLKALFYARGATEVKDVHAGQLIAALSSPNSQENVDDRTFRAALALAAMEVGSFCNKTSGTDTRQRQDESGYTSRKERLLDRFSELLDSISTSDSPAISQAGVNLKQIELLSRRGQ